MQRKHLTMNKNKFNNENKEKKGLSVKNQNPK